MGIQYQAKMNSNLNPIAKRCNTASLQGLNIRFPSDFVASMTIHFQLAFIFRPHSEDYPQNEIFKQHREGGWAIKKSRDPLGAYN